MRALALSAALLAALPAQAATLRTAATLAAPVVRLSDLFDEAGSNAARVLGPAPAPGGRIIVEAAQLAAIARQFGVDWRSLSPADRIVLDRPGRALPRDQALEAIRAGLATAGAEMEGAEIELPGFAPPLLPVESTARPVATDVAYDAASGRFTAVLSVAGEGTEAVSMRVAGRVLATVELPLATARVPAGAVIGPADLRNGRVRAAGLPPALLRDPQQAIGMAVKHALSPGQPVALAELERPALVQKGALVQIDLDSPGLILSARGQATEPGALGDRIRVLNPTSRAIVLAEIIGPGRVRVEPETLPLVAAPRGRTELAAQ